MKTSCARLDLRTPRKVALAAVALAALMVGWPAGQVWAQATERPDSFVQGPERVGQSRTLAGTVIGVHGQPGGTCYVILADRGGGRFFLCGPKGLSMGQAWKGRATQTGTRLAKVGPRWRVLPVFAASGRGPAGP